MWGGEFFPPFLTDIFLAVMHMNMLQIYIYNIIHQKTMTVKHVRGFETKSFFHISCTCMFCLFQAEDQLKLVEDQRKILEQKQRMEEESRKKKKQEQELILNKKNNRPRLSFALGKP